MNERQSTVFEVSDFGVKVRHQNGKTSTIQENVCMPAVEWCSMQARKLNALTLMFYGSILLNTAFLARVECGSAFAPGYQGGTVTTP